MNFGLFSNAPGEIGPVYHGTLADFADEFRTAAHLAKTSKYQLMIGTHFTSDLSLAKGYATGRYVAGIRKPRVGCVVTAYLTIRRPLDLTSYDAVSPDFLERFPPKARKIAEKRRALAAHVGGQPDHPMVAWMLEQAIESIPPAEARAIIEAGGYDGVKYTARISGGGIAPGAYRPGDAWIAFHPAQIRVVRREQVQP